MKQRFKNARLWIAASVLLGLFAVFLNQALAKTPQQKLATAFIEINGVRLEAEIARTANERSKGLSYREHLDADAGMLFVYQKAQPLVFTMRETALALSIAFISDDFVINEIHQMNPFNQEFYPSKFPAKYALEVNQGWFEKKGIKPGDRITLVVE